MKCFIVEVTEQQWFDWASSHSLATIFHNPAWINILAESYGYRPIYITFQDEKGRFLAGIPLLRINSWLTGQRMSCLPFTDFCQPLISDIEYTASIIKSLQSWQKMHGGLQIEIRWPLPTELGIHEGTSFTSHLTPLDPDPNKVYNKFKKKSVHASIVQATKSGIVVKKGEMWADLKVFYNLHCQTRQRQGTPVQPLRFFKMLWEKLLSKGYGFVLLAYKNDFPIAGGVFLYWNKVMIYKYGASDITHWNLRPNNLLIWQAIKWGCENGYTIFDWGKTELANEGLISFKRHWGSQEMILYYSILADRVSNIPTQGRSRRLLSAVIQRSPIWVCRTIGEILYGHFG